jgi:hypothetical protein
MKKSYLLYLFLLLSALMACDNDGDDIIVQPDLGLQPDTENPIIAITSPKGSATAFTIINQVEIKANITDNKGLEEVRVFLADTNGNILEDITKVDNFENAKRSYFLNVLLNSAKSRLPKNSPVIGYTVVIQAIDKSQNVARNSAPFTLYAPDLSRVDFINAFRKINLYEYMDWNGYVRSTPEANLSLALFIMIDKDFNFDISDDEWEKFAADFNLKDQVRKVWDANGDGNLNEDEFNKGFSKLNFFTEWDEDKNGALSDDELGSGIFSQWDRNKNGLLSRDEYEERFFRYCKFNQN